MEWTEAAQDDLHEFESLVPTPLKRYGISHRTPGMVDGWAGAIIALACVITPVLIGAAMFLVWQGLAREDRAPSTWFWVLPPAAATFAMLLWLRRTTEVSRWIRAAVLIPVLHIVLAGLAYWLWNTYASQVAYALTRLPLVDALPAPMIALGLGVAVLAGALLPRSRRQRGRVPGWLPTVVVFVLTHLLVFGLWLPLAAAGWSDLFQPALPGTVTQFAVAVEVAPEIERFAWIALLPPAVIALIVTVVVRRWPQWLIRNSAVVTSFVLIWLAIAVLCRLGISYGGYLAYANLVHVLLSEAMLGLLCIIALAIGHWRALRSARRDGDGEAPWVQRGTVEVDPDQSEQVGWIQYVGWLGGLRLTVRRFRLRTQHGLLDVPDGARLLAPVPDWTTSAEPGGVAAVLRAGDPVAVSGYIEPPAEGVFRHAQLPIPGTDGIVIAAPRAAHESIWRDLLLVVWRPCAFYLLAATLVAVPGVIALTLM